MRRNYTTAAVGMLLALSLIVGATYGGPLRRLRSRAPVTAGECVSCDNGRTPNTVCPLSHMMHHSGYCDFYAKLCDEDTLTSWQGPHATPLAMGGPNCASLTGCLPRFTKERTSLKDVGYTPDTDPDHAFEWDPYPNIADPDRVSNFTMKYARVHLPASGKPVYFQLYSFDYTPEGSEVAYPMAYGHEVKKRAGVPHDFEKSGIPSVPPHDHGFKVSDSGTSYDLLTHKDTDDRNE
jgi:hypothetical protein